MLTTSPLTPKALWWPKMAFAILGKFLVIRRCDMILWKFYGNFMVSRKLEGLSVKLKNARFGPLL
jgi:hypothetical protein